MKLMPLLKLVRLSALPSALADVFGGMALAAFLVPGADAAKLPWLLLATCGIYLGGMASNDVLHAGKDAALGKRRPIVTGEITLARAWAATCLLYAGGLAGAIMAGCTGPALLLVVLTLLYNWLARGRPGSRTPLWMTLAAVAVIALCRGLHVLLPLAAHAPEGMRLIQSIAPLFAGSVAVYFALVTTISLFEDSGGGRAALRAVGWIAVPVVFALPLWVLSRPGVAHSVILGVVAPLTIAAALILSLWRALDAARAQPTPRNLGMAVGTGIRGECLLMASFALVLMPQQPAWGFAALILYPLGRLMTRWISPT